MKSESLQELFFKIADVSIKPAKGFSTAQEVIVRFNSNKLLQVVLAGPLMQDPPALDAYIWRNSKKKFIKALLGGHRIGPR